MLQKSIKGKYIIAIPSYKRSKFIQTHTLKVLEDYKIKTELIYIFVANKLEKEEYIKELPKKYHPNIIIGVKHLYKQRNFICNYFEDSQYIIFMDDDIRKINELSNYNSKERKSNKLIKLKNLNKFILDSFKILQENKSFIWGVYPINNAYFMFPRMTTDLRFLVGPFFGIINRMEKDLQLTLEEKEDVQRTLQYYSKDGIVIRFNDVTIDTTYYKNKGGLQEFRKDRKAESLKSAQYLHKQYPELTRIKQTKKSGITEIELLRK